MAYNKVMDKLGNILLDLTNDTVTENDVRQGKIFHDREGNIKMGTLILNNVPNSVTTEGVDFLKVNFIDIDGTLLYQYTLEEAEALESLPQGPDRTHENLEFQCWNWSLESVKMLNSKGHGAIIGPLYETVDGLTHIKRKVRTPLNVTLNLYCEVNNSNLVIDWGDGTSDTFVDTGTGRKQCPHTYTKSGVYDITIHSEEDYFLGGDSYSYYLFGTITDTAEVVSIQLGNHAHISAGCVQYTGIETIAFYKDCKVKSYFRSNNVECICAPKSFSFSYCSNLSKLKYISFYDFYADDYNNSGIFGADSLQKSYNLKGLILPPSYYQDNYMHFFSTARFIQFTTKNEIYCGNANKDTYDSDLKVTVLTFSPFAQLRGGANVWVDTLPISTTLTSLDNFNISMTKIKIPSGITNINNSFTYVTKVKVVDLSSLETVPTKDTYSLSPSTNTSVVPGDRTPPVYVINESLIESFKTATNWSALADYMVTPEEYVSLGYEEIYGPL